MRSRIHLEVDQNQLFDLIGQNHPSQDALKVNPYTKPYEKICGTVGHETDDTAFEATFDDRFEHNPDGTWKFAFRVPHHVVMRGQVQCACCGPTCFHCGGDGNPVFSKLVPNPVTNGHVGSEYCESVLDLSILTPLAREASQMVGNADYAANLQKAVTALGLDPAWIQSHIPYLLGQVTDVLSGKSIFASDIFYVAVFLQLLLHPDKGWIKNVHNKFSRDWPQRPSRITVTAKNVLHGEAVGQPAPATPSMKPAPAPEPAPASPSMTPVK